MSCRLIRSSLSRRVGTNKPEFVKSPLMWSHSYRFQPVKRFTLRKVLIYKNRSTHGAFIFCFHLFLSPFLAPREIRDAFFLGSLLQNRNNKRVMNLITLERSEISRQKFKSYECVFIYFFRLQTLEEFFCLGGLPFLDLRRVGIIFFLWVVKSEL